MNMQWIFEPLIGCLIGWLTNDIAIKMLFHPRKPLYIGKFHIPLTPGLIPSQKDRIARSIGIMVSDKLLNAQTLKETLASSATLDKLKAITSDALLGFSHDERTLGEILAGRDYINKLADKLQTKITALIQAKLSDGSTASHIAQKINTGARRNLGSLIGRTVSELGVPDIIASLISDKLAERIPDIVAQVLKNIRDDAFSMKICDIYEQNKKYIPAITDKVAGIYSKIIEEHTASFLEAVNITEMVTAKIQTFSPEQLEDMVFGVMNRELRAIVRLGALLGFIMGFFNLITSLI